MQTGVGVQHESVCSAPRYFPRLRPNARLFDAATLSPFRTRHIGAPFPLAYRGGDTQKKDRTMPEPTNSQSEVLHSESHSKLSAEEIAKAVARHNKNHSAAKAENAIAKEKKANKK